MQDQEILEKLKDKRTRCITYTRDGVQSPSGKL